MPGGAQGRVDRVRKSEGLWPYLAKKLDCRIFINEVEDGKESGLKTDMSAWDGRTDKRSGMPRGIVKDLVQKTS